MLDFPLCIVLVINTLGTVISLIISHTRFPRVGDLWCEVTRPIRVSFIPDTQALGTSWHMGLPDPTLPNHLQQPSCSDHHHSPGTLQFQVGCISKRQEGKANTRPPKNFCLRQCFKQWNSTTELYRKRMNQLYLVKLLPVKFNRAKSLYQNGSGKVEILKISWVLWILWGWKWLHGDTALRDRGSAKPQTKPDLPQWARGARAP